MVRVDGPAHAPAWRLDLTETARPLGYLIDDRPVLARRPYFSLSESFVAVLGVSGLVRGKYASNRVDALTGLRRALSERRRPASHR